MIADLEAKVSPFLRYGRSFSGFCQEVLGYKDMLGAHEELCVFLQATPTPFKLVLMPRYTFKSCIATVGYTLWRLALNDNLRVLIYSDATAKAESFLTSIKNHILGLDSDSKFRAVYGAWESDPKKGVWNQSQIVIRPRTKAQAEPSVDTAGIETSKVGLHYDLIVFDDIVSDVNVTTKEQMDKVAECYKKALSLLKPGGEIIMVGTRWHFGDLYGRLLAENDTQPLFAVHLRDGEVSLEGVPYPFAAIGLTQEFLAQQKRSQGTYRYSCLYRNNPVDDDTATFKASDFAFYTQAPAELYVTCCVDPAIAQSTDADSTAITVVGSDSELNMHLLEISAGHMLPDQMIDEVFSLYAHWRFRVLGLETNAFQRMLKTAIEQRLMRERKANPRFVPFSIVEFTGTSKNTKEMRIRALQPLHERGAIRFKGERLELLTGLQSDLAYQMLQFPHAPHDDIVDSLAYHVTLQRAGTTTKLPQEIPYSSAAWFEREQRKRLITTIARQPRWNRPTIPQLVFS